MRIRQHLSLELGSPNRLGDNLNEQTSIINFECEKLMKWQQQPATLFSLAAWLSQS